jgi:hypothetical protein
MGFIEWVDPDWAMKLTRAVIWLVVGLGSGYLTHPFCDPRWSDGKR